MGPYLETTESAAPSLLVLSPASSLVRITLCGVNSPCDGLMAFHESDLGSPLRAIRSAGSARGDGHKRPCRKIRPYPPFDRERAAHGDDRKANQRWQRSPVDTEVDSNRSHRRGPITRERNRDRARADDQSASRQCLPPLRA